jgi:hypothetical protein
MAADVVVGLVAGLALGVVGAVGVVWWVRRAGR